MFSIKHNGMPWTQLDTFEEEDSPELSSIQSCIWDLWL